ncbi:MAG: hypothetical protein LLG97_20375 [Deltaproteobacteria bacterium]|nr:hypothetical protein [Deltaproteobacteria bacterium]
MDEKHLLQDFDEHVGRYTSFVEKLRTLIIDLLGRSMAVHSVTCRAKDRKSFLTKVERAKGRYEAIEDVTDIAGVRIITYFADDVDRVAEVIRDEFVIDADNSVDKRDLLDPDRFGYLSLHYVVTLNPARVSLGEYRRYTGMKAEIQIRSILQHAWAEIEHDLGYKTVLGVPKEVRRQFSRLAGLLEIADKEFTSIRQELNTYETRLPSRIEQTPEEVLIDKSSFKAFLIASNTLRSLDQKIAKFAGGGISEMNEISYEHDVAALHDVGLTTIAQLESALCEREEFILKFAQDWLEGTTAGVGQGVSLLYLGYVLLGEAGDIGRIIKYLADNNIGGKDRHADTAKRVLETYAKIKEG